MANIYDVASAIQNPDIVGSFQQGQNMARQNALGNIQVQQAQQGQQDTQTLRSLAPGIVSGDPAAFAQAAAINPGQAAAYQGAGDNQLARLSGAIKYIDNQPSPQAKETAYQSVVRPYLAQIGASQGKTPPATFAEAEPLMEAARAQIASLPPSVTNQGMPAAVKTAQYFEQNLSPEDRNNANRIHLGLDPRASSPNYSIVNVPDGKGGTIQAFYNKRTGQVEQPDYSALGAGAGGAGAGAPGATVAPTTPGTTLPNRNDAMLPYIQAANARIAAGEDPNVVQADLVKQKATVDAQAQQAAGAGSAPTGGLGYAPPKGQFAVLSPDEIKTLGLPAGTVAQRNNEGKIDIVSKGTGAEAGAPGDPTKSGAEYLATLPPGMARVVQAIAEGNQAPPSASSRSPEAQALLQAVYAYDPTASASNLPTRTATRKSFTSGKDAQNMTALSQLALHLDHLSDQVDQTSGVAVPLVGGLINRGMNAITDPTTGGVTQFDSTANAVAHELRSVFANASGGTEAELNKNLEQLNANASTAQKRAAIQNIAQLVHGRFGILQDKYSQGMGRTEDPFATSFPGAESTILRLSGATAGQPQAAPSNAPANAPAPAPANASPSGWSITRVQ